MPWRTAPGLRKSANGQGAWARISGHRAPTPATHRGRGRASLPLFPSPAMRPAFPEISAAQSLRERADAVLWIKSQMIRHGLNYEQLLAAGCFAPPGVAGGSASGVIKFRDANGHAWNGVGDPPDWLQRAVNAGQSIEHFRVERKE